MADLVRGNKRMTVDPNNVALAVLAMKLLGSSVSQVAILEPGDATRYTLLLTPLRSPGKFGELAHMGIPAAEAGNYIIWTRLDTLDTNREMGILRWKNYPVGIYEFSMVSNPWTQELFAWWFGELFLAMDSIGWLSGD